MTDYTKLRELAQQATPGPWEAQQDFIDMGVPDNSMTLVAGEPDEPSWDRRTLGSIYLHSWADGYNENRNAEFIAAANPAVILALLDELRAAKAQALREAADYVYKAWPHIAGAEIGDYLRTAADELGEA